MKIIYYAFYRDDTLASSVGFFAQGGAGGVVHQARKKKLKE